MSDKTRTPQPALGVEERNTGTLTLPTQSHYEVAIELQDYDRNAVERLYRAVWPGRPLPTTDADLDTETAANMTSPVRAAFTNGGLEAALATAKELDRFQQTDE